MKIKKKISITVILLLFLITASIGISSYLQASIELYESTKINMKNTANNASQIVTSKLDKKLSSVSLMAEHPDIKSMNWLRQKAQLEIFTKKEGFLDMGIVNLDGFTRYPDGNTAQLGDRAHIKLAFKGETNVSDILISRVTNTPIMAIATPIKDGNNNIIGALVARLDATWLSEITDKIGFGEKGYSYIINNKGAIISHRDRDLVLQQKNFIEEAKKDPKYTELAKVLEKMIKGETGFGEYYFDGHIRFISYTPIENTKWFIAIGAIKFDIFDYLYRIVATLIFISIFFLTLCIVCLYLILNFITRPLKQAVYMLKDISQGEGDLTHKLVVHSKDEIGEMANYFNLTIEKIRNLVLVVKRQIERLQNIGSELSSNMTETASAINQINANIKSVKNQTLNQSASVAETSATMDEITKGIEKLNQLIENQSANIAESSSAIEEMMASIANVTQTLIKNSENIKNLTESSELGRHDLNIVVSDIQEIAKESDGLLEISNVIQDIATQTNLLAMNAAIEAAHAGEYGKGFAVVADEIRKLAESSQEQTKTISKVLGKIKTSIEKINSSADSVLSKFNMIETNVKVVSEQEEMIRKAMEEQTEGSKQVLIAISELNDITQKVMSSSTEMLTGSKQIANEANNLNRISEEISASMNEMASGADEITVSVNKINEISIENKESIDTLVNEVNKFKV